MSVCDCAGNTGCGGSHRKRARPSSAGPAMLPTPPKGSRADIDTQFIEVLEKMAAAEAREAADAARLDALKFNAAPPAFVKNWSVEETTRIR